MFTKLHGSLGGQVTEEKVRGAGNGSMDDGWQCLPSCNGLGCRKKFRDGHTEINTSCEDCPQS